MSPEKERKYCKPRTIKDKEFWWEMQAGNEEKALAILKQYPEVAFTISDPASTLSYACGGGMRALVLELLDIGVDPNYQCATSLGQTPLQACLTEGRLKKQSMQILHALLEAGADPNMINDLKGGLTPFMTACSTGQKDIVEKITMLLDYGASLTHEDHAGQAPLHHAACASPELIRLLIQKGADVCAKDLDGETPLHHAARGGGIAAFRTLLSNGADPLMKNKYGNTAADLVGMERDWNEAGASQKMKAIAGWQRKQLRRKAREARQEAGNKKVARNNKMKM